MKKNQRGFSVIELVLVLIILGLIGFIGWYVYQAKNKADKTLNTAANSSIKSTPTKAVTAAPKAADPYAGWKTAILKYEQLSFKYPADWTLDNSSKAVSTANLGGCVTPGTDSAIISAPDGGTVYLSTGIGCGSGGGSPVDSIPINVLGRSYYLSFIWDNILVTSVPSGVATAACLDDSNPSDGTGAIPSKNITLLTSSELSAKGYINHVHSRVINSFCYQTPPNGQTTYGNPQHKEESVADMTVDPDFGISKQIFQSLSY